MTSIINVKACLTDDKVVVVVVGDVSGDINEKIILEDGETLEKAFYDDIVIGVKEILKTEIGENK